MVQKAAMIWADGPTTAPTEPRKQDIRDWGTWLESVIGAFLATGGLIYPSLAALNADLAHASGTMAWVLGDTTVGNNGVYRKVGASGSGSWVRAADLPYSFIIAIDGGVGTTNAIQATSSIPVSESALVWVVLSKTNTDTAVTISFNGAAPLTVRTASGNAPVAGGLVAGSVLMGIRSGTTFRLISDQASTAIQAACEAASNVALAAAVSAISASGLLRFGSLSALLADNNSVLGYSGSGAGVTVTSGVIVEIMSPGFTLQVLPSAATTFDHQTAGGVKLAVPTDRNGFKSLLAFGVAADGSTDDTAKVQAALNSLASGQGLTFPPRQIKTNGCVTHTVSGTKVHFAGTTLVIGDTGANGTINGGATAKIGYLFTNTADLHVTGSFYAIGQGTLGVTSLAGMVFDTCARLQAPVSMRFRNMAVGRIFITCDNAEVGNVTGEDMRGKQPFESPPTSNAGTTENIIGCRYSVFGDATGLNTDKPVRYLSLDSTFRQTLGCSFGATIATNYASSLSSHALAIRNALRCSFGHVFANGPFSAVQIIAYPSDTGIIIDGNHIKSVGGATFNSAASVDSLITQESTGAEIGSNHIGSIDGEAYGEFGILCTSGSLSVAIAELSGAATRLVAVYSDGSGSTARLSFGKLTISDNTGAASPVNFGKGGRLDIGKMIFKTGPSTALTAGVFYNSALGSGSNHAGYDITSITYGQNGSAATYTYVFADTTNGFESGNIGHIAGSGSAAAARFANDNFYVTRGNYQAAAIPTSGAYSQGSIIWKYNVVAAGAPGWLCVSAGSPGTWKAMAAVAA